MIKTLKIAGILSAAAALILFALPVVFGSVSKDIQKFLDSDTIIEKFKKSRDSLAKKNNQELPPLVLQAKAFARYLNPPIEIKTNKTGEIQNPIAPPPIPIVQFKLMSTCVHQTSPELSLALIDQPGEGPRWVRPSDKIGRLVVKEVKSGLLIINDGQKNLEVKIESQTTFDSLASSTSLPLPMSDISLPGRASAATTSAASRASARSPVTTSVPPMPASGVRTTPGFNGPMTIPTMPSSRSSDGSPQSTTQVMSAEAETAALKMMSELEKALAGINENSTEEDMKKADEMIEKYFNQLDNMQISGQEAKKISDLGQQLDKEKQEPNRARPTTIKTQTKTSAGN